MMLQHRQATVALQNPIQNPAIPSHVSALHSTQVWKVEVALFEDPTTEYSGALLFVFGEATQLEWTCLTTSTGQFP